MERVRAGPDTVFNEMMAVNEDLQLPYTMDAHQLSNPYQAKVLRTDVNRAIPSYIPELLDESKLAFEDAFKVTDTVLGIADIEVFDTMTHLIARISNRVIFGKDLCRNQEFLRATVRFAETTPLMAPFIQWSPLFFRPSIFITQTLFEIALLRPEEVEGMRSEVEDALESEGGWNKAAVDRFYKIDSALREVGRYHGLMHFALPRYAIVGCELADGKFVPPGSRIAIDMKAIHFDADIYPDPNRCDLFRFSNMREKNGSGNSNHGFATVDSYYLPFGAGRHACAGRFFAAVELKIMLAHILLEYNISYPHKVNERPRNIIFNGAIIPDSKARLVFKRRKM
uniref:Cytochrome P450 n=1 Tax=Psilocybe cubensis TaxID=181762 RepID=A0A8H7Y3B5_PSICU